MHWDRARDAWRAVRTGFLILFGIGLLSLAAFLSPWWPAGFVVLGLGAFVVEWLGGPPQPGRG